MSQAEENKALIRRFMEARVKADLNAIEEMMAPEFISHDFFPSQQPGREGLKRWIAEIAATFSNRRRFIEDQVAEADKVVSRYSLHATHDLGELKGVAPSGREVSYKAIVIHRIVGGKIAEEWGLTTSDSELMGYGLEHVGVLSRVNETLLARIPDNMFVTCFYAVLEPNSGSLSYANAGHDLPYLYRGRGEAEELRARGMPLGLMPGMSYEEGEASLKEGDNVLFCSDGLVEAHDPHGEMFGFPRLRALITHHHSEEERSLVHLQDRFRTVSYGTSHETSYLRTFVFGKGARAARSWIALQRHFHFAPFADAMRRLPDGVYHCPACGSEVLPLRARAADTRRKDHRWSAT